MLQSKKNLKIFAFFNIIITFIFVFISYSFNVLAQDTFSDIEKGTYYYDSIIEMNKKGLISGYPDATFRPENSVTVAEALTIIFRNAKIDFEDKYNKDEYWYSDVMARAISLGIVDENTNPNSYASRLDIGKFIIGAYCLNTSKTSVQNVFVDTNSIIANTMYENKIFNGVPVANGVAYLPYEEIKRADICLVLYRLYNTLNTPLAGIYVQNGVIVNSNPTTFEDFNKLIKTLDIDNNFTITIPYNIDLSDSTIYLSIRKACIDAYEYNFAIAPEHFSFVPNILVKGDIITKNRSTFTVTLYNNYIETSELKKYISSFDKTTDDVIRALKSIGKLSDSMSDLEKARVIFEYVVNNVKYDTNREPDVLSYTGYGASDLGIAVCQGYTAFFNKLCENVGIISESETGKIKYTNEVHTWSKLYIDNEWHYYDTTYGDGVFVDFTYCDIPKDILMIDRVVDDMFLYN